MGHGSGNLDRVQQSKGEASLDLENLSIGKQVFSNVSLRASGPVTRPHLSANAHTAEGIKLEAETHTNLELPEFTEFKASVSGQGEPLEASASRIFVGDSRVGAANAPI